MLAERLLERRLLVVTGKGGVGKSVVGAALALLASERGKRTLLVEIDAPLEAARYLDAAPAGPKPSPALPNLFTVNLDPRGVMDEYVRSTLRVAPLVRRIVESPLYGRFVTAAPGLRELMVLGKLMVLEEERLRFSRRPSWDLIIVDAPATGHGLSFLKVPQAAAAAVPVGPVGANARRILGLLRDAKRTAMLIVAIPEEMAVVEAVWFHNLATEELGVDAAGVVLNAAQPRRFDAAEDALILRLSKASAQGRLARGVSLQAALLAARREVRKAKLARFYKTRLERALPGPVPVLPFLYARRFGLEQIRELSRRLAAA